ncbi:MAG: YbdD/YjiX family protein [Burkholderiales bacterium]|jgi:uncharacterized short protein YbdD (DUF466 family)|nr:YbdD/YjiX family protein [Burkholderiales bacterium]
MLKFLKPGSSFRSNAYKVVQTCRLMVGVHDYENYLAHMQAHHPEVPAKTRKEFYQYCLEARFPGAGKISKCPC